MAGVFGEPLPPVLAYRVARIRMAQTTGWTLDYIDGLSVADWFDYWAVAGGLGDLDRFRLGEA